MKKTFSFKDYVNEAVNGSSLTEAAFSQALTPKASDSIANLIGHTLGVKFIRLKKIPGSDSETVSYRKDDGTSGEGYMYVSSSGNRLRVGHTTASFGPKGRKSNVINAIDIWDPKNRNFYGNTTRGVVLASDKNIIHIIKGVAEYLKTGKVSTEGLTESFRGSLTESEDFSNDESPYLQYAYLVMKADLSGFSSSLQSATKRNKVKALPGFNQTEFDQWRAGFKTS
jgi:hypothetical protein